jgi:two-component system NtrC family sensor kinase
MKIVRFVYFQPWDWIIGVGCYEDEFYQAANTISSNTLQVTSLATVLACLICVVLIGYAAKILTNPIQHMTQVIRRVRSGHINEKMHIDSNDELGELARTFNHMTEKLAHNQEMEASLAQQGKMASLGILSSGGAHEINNPLTVISGQLQILKSKAEKSGDTNENIKRFNTMLGKVDKIARIVSDLLAYGRPQKARIMATSVKNITQQAIEAIKHRLGFAYIRFTINIPDDLPKAMVDPQQLGQILINLLINAQLAMPDSGSIGIKAACIRNQVAIFLSDTGCGIAQKANAAKHDVHDKL